MSDGVRHLKVNKPRKNPPNRNGETITFQTYENSKQLAKEVADVKFPSAPPSRRLSLLMREALAEYLAQHEAAKLRAKG